MGDNGRWKWKWGEEKAMGGSHKQSDIPVILLCHCPCCRSHSHHHHHHHYYVFIVIIIMMIIINHNQFNNHHHSLSVFKSRSQRVGENIVSASISCSEKKIEEISEIFFFSYVSTEKENRWNCEEKRRNLDLLCNEFEKKVDNILKIVSCHELFFRSRHDIFFAMHLK